MISVECGVSSVEGRKRGDRAVRFFDRSTLVARPSTAPRHDADRALGRDHYHHDACGRGDSVIVPANDDRRLREATRGLNTYITGAQARAASSHRPFGIAIKRLSGITGKNVAGDTLSDNGVSVEVQYAEQPAPYSGFDANSRACVALYPNQDQVLAARLCDRAVSSRAARQTAGLATGWQADLFPSGMIRPGDVIEINGTQFELLNDTSANTNITVNNISQSSTNPVYYFAPPNNGTPQILAKPLNDSGQQIFPKYDNAGYNIGFDQEPQPAKRRR